ncbi:MucB/RseB C-terminal domain-containing protein [Ramlibacter tataouinensis]|nr:MucB/RseB C-terminal domain-containing protein [Ramlibacter tataouinensis]
MESPRLVFLLPQAARRLLAVWALGSAGLVAAQGAAPVAGAAPERGVNEWLMRMHEASRQRNYVGTFVVSSNAGAMSTARIWHACDAEQQVERVESLTGAPRSTLRRNDEVVTLWPEKRVARTERRDSLGVFPDLLKSSGTAIAEFYTARRTGSDRVAGYDADVVHIAPKDGLRFGYRIWSEKKTGLVVKLQTLGGGGEVLEQAAFSELQLDAPLKADKLAELMAPPPGWRVERSDAVKTDAAAEGWALKASPPGFKPMSCYRRRGSAAEGTVQWIFSDGLASVSLFIEGYDRQRHLQEGLFAAGASQTLTRRVQDWWLTAVGEVPPQTLRAFAQNLERRK